MSNNDNIYNILNNFNKIAKEEPAPVPAPVKVKTKLQESMEQVVNEKYMGFKKTVAAIKKGGSAEDPEAVAAAIGRKKYGKEKFQKAAAAGKKLNEKAANPYAVGMAVAKKKAGIIAKPAHDLPKKVIKKAHEIAKKIDEAQGATTYTVAYKDNNNPKKSNSTQVKATSAVEAKAAFAEWNSDNTPGRFTYLGSRPDVDEVYEGFDDMIKDVNKKAKEKGTGKFDKKEISTGTVYTRKYNPKSGETDDTENVSAEKRGRGRPKKSAFEDMSTIDKMIAESFGELFEGTSRPVGDPVSKAAPTAPAVGSGIRVTPMPALATPKPAPGMGTIKRGVFTADPPKPGEQGVAIPQGLDEVNAEDSGSEPWTGQGLSGSAYKDDRNPLVVRSKLPMGANMTGSTAGPQPYRVKISGYNKPGEQGEPLAPEMDSMNSMDPGTPQPQPTAFDPAPVARPDLDEADAEMKDMRRMAGLKGGQKKLDRDQDGELTAKDFSMLRKGLEEGGRDDYDEIRDKIQWLQGAPNYLSRDEAKETAYYTKDTDPVWDGYRDDTDEIDEDDMEEGNAFSGAVARAKADGVQPGEKIQVGDKEYDLKEGDAALNQMRRIAGLKECGMSPISGMASDMEKQQGNMNISTSQNSDGTKSVTISADGDAASDLMQMLKLAGMSGGGAAPAAAAEPEIVVVAQDGEEAMEEEKDPRYQASTTPDEQVAPVQALTKGGNGDVAGQEKTMKPGGYQFGDNNLAMQESLSTQLMKEYNSIKVKK